MIFNGDCLVTLKELESNSVDSLVTDPPAGISFMGKSWDSDKGGRKQWVAWMTEVMRECLRVLKPGAHGLVWAIPRTSHWTATALEEAGFEVRDVVTHLFGSGFPKSLDISKAIDKAAGAKRDSVKRIGKVFTGSNNNVAGISGEFEVASNIPATDGAKAWSGWGTALKPASEHWILVRKPISEKTVAANVLKWGVGGLNIDGSRVATSEVKENNSEFNAGYWHADGGSGARWTGNGTNNPQGRFPANLVLSHSNNCTEHFELSAEDCTPKWWWVCAEDCAVKALDAQSGTVKGQPSGASRFFYCAKISTSERNAGMETNKSKRKMSEARPGSPDLTGKFPDHDGREKTGNFHPTVKPKKLMSYLIKLITPAGGIVLDPFLGSGSTAVAAMLEGYAFIGIEQDAEYCEIAKKRVEFAEKSRVEV